MGVVDGVTPGSLRLVWIISWTGRELKSVRLRTRWGIWWGVGACYLPAICLNTSPESWPTIGHLETPCSYGVVLILPSTQLNRHLPIEWLTKFKVFTIWLFTEKVWSRIMDLSQEDSNGAEVQIQTELCGVGQVASPSWALVSSSVTWRWECCLSQGFFWGW